MNIDTLQYICINKFCIVIKNSLPKDSEDSDKILNWIRKWTPTRFISELELIFFNNHFQFQDSVEEILYLMWYKLFLPRPCQRFWLNKCFKDDFYVLKPQYRTLTFFPLSYAIKKGHKDVVKLLMQTLYDDQISVDLKFLEERHLSAFDYALKSKDYDIVVMLLQAMDNEDPTKRIDINIRDQDQRYHRIFSLFSSRDTKSTLKIARWLFAKTDCNGERLIKLSERDYLEILDQACSFHDVELIKFLLSLDDIIWHHDQGCVCYNAVYNDEHGAEIVKYFIDHFPVVDFNAFMSCTPPLFTSAYNMLHNACQSGKTEIVKHLFSTLNDTMRSITLDLNMVQDDIMIHGSGNNGFHLACENGHFEIVQLFLSTLNHENVNLRIDLNATNLDGETALHIASKCGHLEIARVLLQSEINLHAKNKQRGETAFQLACRYIKKEWDSGCYRTFRHLFQTNVNSQEEDKNFIPNNEHIQIVDLFLQFHKNQDIGLNSRNDNKETALHHTCREGHLEANKLLLQTLDHESKIQLNLRNVYGDTALHLACRFGELETVRLLLDTLDNEDVSSRVEVNARNHENETALHVSCKEGHWEIVELLLQTLKHPDVSCRIQICARNFKLQNAFDLLPE